MRILVVANYYYPEEIGSSTIFRQLAEALTDRGNEVTVLTSFPSYPAGIIFPSHANRLFQRETIHGVAVIRTATYATTKKTFWPRFLSFGMFCASSLLQGCWEVLRGRLRADAVYVVMPPLPLAVSGWALAWLTGARLVLNVQDIYPEIAVQLGFLRSAPAIRLFSRMELWSYRKANRIVVISEGFRENLLGKGVPPQKIAVVPNWADSDSIQPGPKATAFRKRVQTGDRFLVVYSGGFTHNSCLNPVLDAAALLPPERFHILLIGTGVKETELRARAGELNLRHVEFLPFQPLELYGEVLASSDVTLVTLNGAARLLSVPSKIYKQMAAGRPVVAITEGENELSRLVETGRCGVVVHPDDPAGLAAVLERLSRDSTLCAAMGAAGREYVVAQCSRERCVTEIESICSKVSDHD